MQAAIKISSTLIVWFVACVNGQLPVHNHQVTLSCGSGSNVQDNQILPGPPGKRGPAGTQGLKGEAGEPGSCVKDCNSFERRLTTLEDQSLDLHNSKMSCDIVSCVILVTLYIFNFDYFLRNEVNLPYTKVALIN